METLSDSLGALGGIVVGVTGTLIYAKATGQEVRWRRKFLLRTLAHTFLGAPCRARARRRRPLA